MGVLDMAGGSLSKLILHAFHVIFAFLRSILVALAKPLAGIASIGSSGLVIGAATVLGFSLIVGVGLTVLPESHQDTMMYFQDNGHSYDHVAAILSVDNGTKEIYLNMTIKPGDNVTFDLSKALGYFDQPVPPGTTITLSGYANILSANGGGNDTLNMNDDGSNINVPGITTEQLPPTVKGDMISSSFNPSDGQQYFNSIIPGNGSVFWEETLTVNADGTVSSKFIKSPVLCQIVTLP
jgi:hypothetical protein